MQCCVPFCANTSSQSNVLSFHRFPDDVNLQNAWLRALGTETVAPESAMVCSQHFLSEDMHVNHNGLRIVNLGAVPSAVQVCLMCLDTDSKLVLMSKQKMEEAFEKLTGHPLQVCERGALRHTLCVHCRQRLLSFSRFRDCSRRAHSLLMELLEEHHVVTAQHIETIKQTNKHLNHKLVQTSLGPNHCDLHLMDQDKHTDKNKTDHTFIEIDTVKMEDVTSEDENVNNDVTECKNFKHSVTVKIEPEVIVPDTGVLASYECEWTRNRTEIRKLNDEPSPSAGSAQAIVAPLSTSFATNRKIKMQATEAITATLNSEQTLNSNISELGNLSSQSNTTMVFKKSKKAIEVSQERHEKSYLCDVCSYKTTIKCNLLKHIRTHTDLKPYSCNMCNYKCAQKITLLKHIRTHTGEKPFSCEICNHKFAQKSYLLQHIRTHTADKPYTCDTCNRKFAGQSNLLNHMKSHAGEKPYYCETCNYKCARLSHLSSHMRTHTGEKPYSCNICIYKCSSKFNLLRHIKTHTGEKPYSCEICNYKSAEKKRLLNHMRTHTGEKPYSCDICDFKFAQKGNLLNHIKTHTGVKPYSCEICGYKFARKSHLLIHMKTHTGEKPYSCDVCNYKCVARSYLLQHMKTHSGEKSNSFLKLRSSVEQQ
ncbi:histone-lysine N-methyltransferase PRDM9 [Bicyclus anynana]|uniref:Histone-lysine N-methyltransferase PRDM9 n=1 Tax=Bicyclus anynana TaxID=110368 RepID=A0ABM3M2N3_BICAN|nr:histone-lysine N-methyltransferase PRDM9 [Bicyclus anynana]